MSENTLSVDLSAMADVARLFSASVSSEESRTRAIVAKLENAGAPWGGDAAGQAFWACYGSRSLKALDSMQQLRLQVLALADNTKATVRSYTGTEEANTEVANSDLTNTTRVGDKDYLQ